MGIYLIFYILFIPFLFLDFIKIGERDKKIALITMGVILSLFIGTRTIGPDLETYNILYGVAPLLNNLFAEFEYYTWFSKFEPLFILLYSIFKTLGFSFEWFNLLFSTTFVFLFIYRVKDYTKYPFLSVFIYVGFAYMSGWSALRQFMAASIFFFSLQYLFEEKKWKYVLMIIVATLLHYSSIVLFPLVLIPKKKFSNIWYFVLMLSFLALYFSGVIDSVTSVLLSYLPFLDKDKTEVTMLEGGTLISSIFLLWTFLNVFILLFYKHVKYKVKKFEYFFNLFFSCYLAYILLVGLGGFGRVIMFYKIIFPVFLTLLAVAFSQKQRILFILFLIAISLLIYINTITGMDQILTGKDHFTPYKSWLIN